MEAITMTEDMIKEEHKDLHKKDRVQCCWREYERHVKQNELN